MSSRSAPQSAFPVYISSRHWPVPEQTMPQCDAMELFLKYKESGEDRFIHAILTGNMRRIHALCAKREYQYPSIDPQDLVQEASIGFLTGVRNYEPEKGASIASYSYFWSKKAIVEYIREAGYTIKVPDNCNRAYKLMMKRMDSAREEYQSEHIPADVLLHDKHPYEIAGAIHIMARTSSGIGPEPYENFAPGERNDLTHAMAGMAGLPEPQRSIVMAFYGFGEEDMKKLMRRTGLEQAEIERIVQGSIEKIKRGFPKGDVPQAFTHTNPRGRLYGKAEQTVLFKGRR